MMEQDLQGSAPTAGTGEASTNLVQFRPGAMRGNARDSSRDSTHDSASSDDGTPATSRAAALLRALQRLESTIDEEILALQQRQPVDFDQYSRRKNRSLLELSRSGKAIAVDARNPVVVSEVARLRAKLEQNHSMLRVHYDAVRAVSDIICRSIREAESDGTYPATAGRKEPR